MKKGTTLKSNIGSIYGSGPIQYQQGWTHFYKLKFKVTPDVLIPRPETELLVDEIIKIVNRSSSIVNRSQLPINNHPLTVIDVGTGSGCIAISVAKNLPGVKIIATDFSDKALEIAKQNAKFHQVEDQIVFLQADLLSFISENSVIANPAGVKQSQGLNSEIASSAAPPRNDARKVPDIIVANLPYIPSANLMLIDPLVSEFEPRTALDGGQDGFDLYRKLFAQMRDSQFFPKVLMIEINDTQSEIAPLEAKKYFPSAKIELKKDLNKVDRFLIIHF